MPWVHRIHSVNFWEKERDICTWSFRFSLSRRPCKHRWIETLMQVASKALGRRSLKWVSKTATYCLISVIVVPFLARFDSSYIGITSDNIRVERFRMFVFCWYIGVRMVPKKVLVHPGVPRTEWLERIHLPKSLAAPIILQIQGFRVKEKWLPSCNGINPTNALSELV